MYGVELYAAVRLAVVDEGLSHHEAGRRYGIDRRTVKKMLSYSAPPGYRRTKPVRRPKLDGFTGTWNVPTYYSPQQRSPAKANRQFDYAVASRGFHERIGVRARNGLDQWGSSDHRRLKIEVDLG